MYKWLKKSKIYKIIASLLVAIFVINLAGCGRAPESNGIMAGEKGGRKNVVVGTGANITGYSIYSQSTFDQMSKNLFFGYLIYQRSFILVVLPGEGDGSDDHPYKFNGSETDYADNKLYSSAKAGVYEYNEQGYLIDQTQKLLMYYVTQSELLKWFEEAGDDDNFFTQAHDFMSSKHDIGSPRNFQCRDLVNLGDGLNADAFCGTSSQKGVLQNSKGNFNNNETGGLIVLFGEGSIEGYITYDDIANYNDGKLVEGLLTCTRRDNPKAFDYTAILNDTSNNIRANLSEVYDNIDVTDADVKQSIIGAYTEWAYINSTSPCARLQTMFDLIAKAIITDAKDNGLTTSDLAAIRVEYYNRGHSLSNEYTEAQKEGYRAVVEMIETYNNFSTYRVNEAFNLQFSLSLYSRLNSKVSVSSVEVISGKKTYDDISEITYQQAVEYVEGKGPDKNYMILVTGEGFILDRGTEEDQVALGAADMAGFSEIMQELVRMDACPNETIAAKFFNMLANLKIIVGSALAIAGAVVAAAAVIGLVVASVIAKLAVVALATPVPGGRIVALVLAAIAGLIALGVGLFTLFQGLKEKARLKGLGASETNYCDTYKATLRNLLGQISINIPVYYYNIPKDSDPDVQKDLAVKYCTRGEYSEKENRCVDSDGNKSDPVQIQMYYYADRAQSNSLNIMGLPSLLYFSNGKLVDQIYGATTPEFVVEALRLWGVLAMREMLYVLETKAEENKIGVSHTSNTAVRTMQIEGIRYCYTTDYALDLYNDSAVNSSFCYFDDTPGRKYVEANDVTWSGKPLSEIYEIELQNSKEFIEQKLKESYANHFSKSNTTKFNQTVSKYFEPRGGAIETHNAPFDAKCELNGGGLDLCGSYYTSSPDASHLKVYFDYDNNPSDYIEGDIYFVNNKLYLINDDGVYGVYNEESSVVIKMIRKLQQGKSYEEFALELGELQDEEGNYIFLELVSNMTILNYLESTTASLDKGDNAEETEIPLYFTVTVKEKDHSTSNDEKSCNTDKGEHLYTKKKNGKFVCRDSDGDKFTPELYDAEYTTSILAAKFKIINTVEGTVVEVEWADGFKINEEE